MNKIHSETLLDMYDGVVQRVNALEKIPDDQELGDRAYDEMSELRRELLRLIEIGLKSNHPGISFP